MLIKNLLDPEENVDKQKDMFMHDIATKLSKAFLKELRDPKKPLRLI